MGCKRSTYWITGVLMVIILAGVLIFGTFRTRQYNMASSLLPDDLVLVNELVTGIRLGETRLPAFRDFRNGDLVLLNNPQLTDVKTQKKPRMISRIAGTPGDTVIIWDKNLYLNRKIVEPPETIRRMYRIVTDGSPVRDAFLSRHHIEDPKMIAEIGIWDLYMDTLAYQAISDEPNIKQIRSQKMYANDSSLDYWPYSSYYTWNRDQTGPLIVPYKGLTVELSLSNIDEYREIIMNHEHHEIVIDFRGIHIDGALRSSYTFSKDYYFVLDDNRDNPSDSRKIGYIPEDHLIGRVIRCLYSPLRKKFLIRLH